MKITALILGAALAALSFSGAAQKPTAEVVAGIAKYQAVSDCMSQGKDSSAQVACVLGIALLEKGGAGSAAPQQPQIVMAEAPCQGFWGCAFGFVGKGLQKIGDFADRNAVGLGQIYANQRLGMRQASSQDRASDNTRDANIALYGAFERTNIASVGAVRDTSSRFAQVWENLPPSQANQYTLNNAQGVQFGGGTLTYTGPVNRNCNGGTAAAGGNATGTTGTTNGGAGAPSNGGNC